MVSLQKHLREEFNSGARARGEELFRYGGVRHLTGDALNASATVTGNGTYRVEAERVGRDLLTSCTCPYFVDNAYCKHLWAFLLEAEKAGLLGGLDSSSPRFMLELTDDLQAVGGNGNSPASPRANWRSLLLQLHSQNTFSPPVAAPETWPEGRELYFVITQTAGVDKGIPVELLYSDPLKKGGLSKTKDARLSRDAVATIADKDLRELLHAIAGVPDVYSSNSEKLQGTYFLRGRIAQTYLERMCRTGRCYLRAASSVAQDQWTRLKWDESEPWRLSLRMDHDTAENLWRLSGILERTGQAKDLSVPVLLSKHGILISDDTVARFDANGGYAWAEILKREGGEVIVPDAQAADFAFEVAKTGTSPLKLPEELAYQEVRKPPVPCLKIESTQRYQGRRSVGALRFLYGTKLIDPADREDSFPDVQNRQIVHRDRRAEAMALTTLYGLGLRTGPWYGSGSGQWDLTQQDVLRVVPELASLGWRVEAEGIRYRSASNFEATVQSGIDWFELNASVDFEGVRVELPRLLRAVANGSRATTLANGEYGLIPEDILERYKLLVGLGKTEGGSIRFNKNQAGLLDVLLAERPEVKVDQIFAEARQRLRSFGGVQAAKQPPGFTGTLRHYQLEGLGWMQFLDEFSLGGCLADDMGVGKTPQVLALLETRRGKSKKPALIVVPRSLVYNWRQEAARFTPHLKVLDHSAPDRNRKTPDFSTYDAVLATYGTIRNDALLFRKMEFDYVILDEAQAIKNPASESAKAARLLNGRRRLALSGTPVENHLGELWSLFEFLNPGMLGQSGAFKTAGTLRNPDGDTREMLARAVRPFILRRTKEQVATELPPKQEQTLFCDLEKRQRQLYNELRDYYRAKLMAKVNEQGLAKSKIQVLEALLRLRQAACHPALLDEKHKNEPSAKLELLMERLREVMDEGHKTLVFSQFTSLLAIVRESLDREGIVYEYLDGQTRDRQAHVERFQNSPEIPVFLISLKAGGVGLNLTAADYVFLLDPWWNPAVEAQAIDRTHRIGQLRSVFAYRLIARDTVEEKVLELQSKKRDLAAAIINADNSLIRDLKAEDLEALLS